MNILFLCTHNACRSILAESIATQLGDGLWSVASAGSEPAGRVHPNTLKELENRRYPTAALASKSWEAVQHFTPNLVITLCDQTAGEACPVWFGKAVKAHWGLPDPTKETDSAQKQQGFEQIISTLEARLQRLAEFVKQQPCASSEQLQIKLKQLEGIN